MKTANYSYNGLEPRSTYTNVLYARWASMKTRVKNHKPYSHIEICERWESFENFAEDMVKVPQVKGEFYTLDRIDNSLGYFKENCRWSSMRQQMNNRSCTLWVVWRNKEMSLSDFARLVKQPYARVKNRYKNGWSLSRIAKTKEVLGECKPPAQLVWRGKTYSYRGLAKETGILYPTLRNRIKVQGLSVKEAVRRG